MSIHDEIFFLSNLGDSSFKEGNYVKAVLTFDETCHLIYENFCEYPDDYCDIYFKFSCALLKYHETRQNKKSNFLLNLVDLVNIVKSKKNESNENDAWEESDENDEKNQWEYEQDSDDSQNNEENNDNANIKKIKENECNESDECAENKEDIKFIFDNMTYTCNVSVSSSNSSDLTINSNITNTSNETNIDYCEDKNKNNFIFDKVELRFEKPFLWKIDPNKPSTSTGITDDNREILKRKFSADEVAFEFLKIAKNGFKKQVNYKEDSILKLSETLEKLGEILIEQKKYEDAIKELKECLEIREKYFSNYILFIAYTCNIISLAYIKSFNKVKAKFYYEKSLDLVKNTFNFFENFEMNYYLNDKKLKKNIKKLGNHLLKIKNRDEKNSSEILTKNLSNDDNMKEIKLNKRQIFEPLTINQSADDCKEPEAKKFKFNSFINIDNLTKIFHKVKKQFDRSS